VKQYFVYIMSNLNRTLYVGVTNQLERRVHQHKHKLIEGFTSRYDLTKLVWYAETNDVTEAIAYEKKIKGWTRAKKVALIEEINPGWEDLSSGWFTDGEPGSKESDPSLRSR
jgi:putative endonuclease